MVSMLQSGKGVCKHAMSIPDSGNGCLQMGIIKRVQADAYAPRYSRGGGRRI